MFCQQHLGGPCEEGDIRTAPAASCESWVPGGGHPRLWQSEKPLAEDTAETRATAKDLQGARILLAGAGEHKEGDGEQPGGSGGGAGNQAEGLQEQQADGGPPPPEQCCVFVSLQGVKRL